MVDSGDTGWRSLASRARRLPPGLWLVVGAVVLSVATWQWVPAVAAGGAVGVGYAGQAWARSRAAAADRAAQPGGGGVWDGWLATATVDWFWERTPPWYVELVFSYRDLPVRLVADHSGIVVAVRGPLISRLRRQPPVTIPWPDIAGARQRDRGYTTPGGTVSLVHLTDVTVDVVGVAATSWREWYEDDELDEDEALDEALDERDAGDERERESYLRTSNGPDWRPGTAALRFTTRRPDGLVELATQRGSGRPWPGTG
ncbi:MAG: hypothetical protein HYR62_11165 [Actinobacteria bacterium]|nr:hypothetical protein [Actinomycetota bacterium]MBI3686869.1 hypothetical protein [Actinomycetota bacterium]